MRIALVSDIHGNLPALEAVAADLSLRGADVVVNLGDALSGPLLPRETAAFLMGTSWLHLAGNHERQLLWDPPDLLRPADAFARERLGAEEKAWLAGLPATADLEGVHLCHGTPSSDFDYFLETVDERGARPATAAEIQARLGGCAAAAVACGHSHVPRVFRTAGNQLLVNPGSVGQQAFAGGHPWPHVMATGSPMARYALLERRGPDWEARLLEVAYDPSAMAALAAARGWPLWERALLRGAL
jgi:predicted phosphodiesterase